MYPGILYYGPFFLTAFFILTMALFAFRRRNQRGGWQLTLVCISAGAWAAIEGLFYLGLDHETYILLLNIQHVPIDFNPLLVLFFILVFFNLDSWITKTRVAVLLGIIVVWQILVWTNPLHGLVFSRLWVIDTGPMPMLGIEHTPVWWLMIIFQYFLLSISMFVTVRQVFTSVGLYRTQALLMLPAFVVILFLNVIYVTGNSPIPNVDYSPLGFSLLAAVTALGFLRFNFLDISPVAKAEIFRGVEDAIVVLDPKNRVIELNPSAEVLFEIGFSEAIAKEARQLFAHHTQLLEFMDEAKQGEAVLEVDGQNRTYDVNVSLLHNKKGTVLGRVIALRDITKRRQAEEEKDRLESELRHVQKMEALGTLAGGIAHDFNNILVAILGYSDLALKDMEKGEPNPSRIVEIVKAGIRAKDLVNQILAFSRKVKPELDPLDLNQVVIQTEKMLERTIPKMIRIEMNLQGDLWLTNADPGQISQVLLNLGTNAKDAMPEGGDLVIKTENAILEKDYAVQHPDVKPGPYVLLTVSDTGNGMDKETQEHIFEPFYTKKEVGKGTGLGLATVYGIVKNHGGHIICSSRPGQGTIMRVYLPASSSRRQTKEVSISKEERPKGGDETVLFVDDEKPIRDLGQEVLTCSGYKVLLAGNGEEALELYKEHGSGIDLVVLDISMPGMGGHRCLKELLSLDSQVKVLVISGYSLSGQLKDIMESGASGFVPKPFSVAKLLNNVREVLDRRS